MQRTSTRKRKSPDFLSSTACNSTTKENPPQKSKHNAPVSVVKDTEEPHFDSTLVPTRNSKDELVFLDYPEFRPNLTPEEVLRRGSFGGTYFRPIYSSVVNRAITSKEAIQDLPEKWLAGVNIPEMITSSTYTPEVNKYKVKCGQGLSEWEASGWITAHDPYGWFQWYCRFYLGRRCPDDARQVKRALGVMGAKGRWRRFLANKCVASAEPLEAALLDFTISPKVRQLLQHWGYAITLDALKLAKKMKK